MENKKYVLTNITMDFMGRTLYRIKALKDFADIKAGELGGWVQTEDNLSQEGNCWIYDNGKCMDNARIYTNSIMCDNSLMYGNSMMFDYSRMFDYSIMCDNSVMHDHSVMLDNSIMRGESVMNNNGFLKNKENLYGKLVTKVDRFIEINNTEGRIVTGVLKDGKILYNIGCQNEITKEVFVDRIYNEDGGIEKHPYRKEYLKIIDMIELYFSK